MLALELQLCYVIWMPSCRKLKHGSLLSLSQLHAQLRHFCIPRTSRYLTTWSSSTSISFKVRARVMCFGTYLGEGIFRYLRNSDQWLSTPSWVFGVLRTCQASACPLKAYQYRSSWRWTTCWVSKSCVLLTVNIVVMLRRFKRARLCT